MKNLLVLAGALLASTAVANPFDSFVGEYSVVGSPKIQKIGDVRECVRYGIPSLTGFSVAADTNGYHQTHMLHFQFASSAGRGWIGHPVMEFSDTNEFHSGGAYAKTSGDANRAENECTSWGAHFSNPLVVVIQRDGGQYRLEVRDSRVEDSRPVAACIYDVELSKK